MPTSKRIPAGTCKRIVATGHRSPEGYGYDHPKHERGMVLTGASRLWFEDRTVELKPGDYLNIPARTLHRVECTSAGEPTVWLAVFYH